MKQYTKPSILTAILLVPLFFSCTEIFDLSPSNNTPKLVVNAILQPDSAISVRVSKTIPYFGEINGSSTLVKDPVVKLYINDRFEGEMEPSPQIYGFGEHLFTSPIIPASGDKVKFEVSAADMEPVWGETVIPHPLIIHQVDTVTFHTLKHLFDDYYTYNNYRYYPDISPYNPKANTFQNLRIKLSVEDTEPSIDNYYTIYLFQQLEHNYLRYNYLGIYQKNDPIFTEPPKNAIGEFWDGGSYGYSNYFNDHLFKENRYTLDISITDYYLFYIEEETIVEVENNPITILITSLSKELFLFNKSIQYREDESAELIMEPVITYTNVHGGVGIIGAQSFTGWEIVIPEYDLP